MNNAEIKKYARDKGVRMYELASEFEMNESVLSRMFRCELDEEMKQVIIAAINRLADEKETTGSSGKTMAVTSLMRERVLSKSNIDDEPKKTASSTKSTAEKIATTKSVKPKTVPQESAISEDAFNSLFDTLGVAELHTEGELHG